MENITFDTSLLSNHAVCCAVLYLAAQNGHKDVVKYISELPITLSPDDLQKFTQLYLAAQRGHLGIIKLIFENADKVGDMKEKDVISPHAVENADVIIEAIVPSEVTTNSSNIAGSEDLAGNENIMQITKTEIDDYISIFEAAQLGSELEVKKFLDDGVDIDGRNADGKTALHLAAACGKTSNVAFLIKYGANVESEDEEEHTPLHLACENASVEIVSLLIKEGANVNHKNKNGDSVLHYAVRGGSEMAVKMLLQKKANLNIVNNTGTTVLEGANNKNIMELLVQNGFNLRAVNICGHSLLQQAVSSNNIRLLEFLLKTKQAKGVYDINEVSSSSVIFNPLHAAAYHDQYEAAELLLKYKADVNYQSKWSKRTALMLAAGRGHLQIVKLLLSYGADKKMCCSKYNWRALDFAKQKKHQDIINILK